MYSDFLHCVGVLGISFSGIFWDTGHRMGTKKRKGTVLAASLSSLCNTHTFPLSLEQALREQVGLGMEIPFRWSGLDGGLRQAMV